MLEIGIDATGKVAGSAELLLSFVGDEALFERAIIAGCRRTQTSPHATGRQLGHADLIERRSIAPPGSTCRPHRSR
jgi:hypothetical protein